MQQSGSHESAADTRTKSKVCNRRGHKADCQCHVPEGKRDKQTAPNAAKDAAAKKERDTSHTFGRIGDEPSSRPFRRKEQAILRHAADSHQMQQRAASAHLVLGKLRAAREKPMQQPDESNIVAMAEQQVAKKEPIQEAAARGSKRAAEGKPDVPEGSREVKRPCTGGARGEGTTNNVARVGQ